MTLKDKVIFGAVVVVVAIIAQYAVATLTSSNGHTPTFGAVGNMLAENYIPYIRVNGGFNTNDPMTVGGLLTATANLIVGSSGTSIARINTGTCYVQAYATTIAATSTAKVDCQGTAAVGGITTANDAALTGVTFGDNVVATESTTTAGTTYAGLHLIAATASTTAGYIQLEFSNLTGATFTWPTTGAATGTVSYVVTH